MTVSLTLFTTCKPFEGKAARVQRNALRSWALGPLARSLFSVMNLGFGSVVKSLAFVRFQPSTEPLSEPRWSAISLKRWNMPPVPTFWLSSMRTSC